ncbi:DUF2157 domain-containing protein [Flavobacterium rivuli]|nr:DUF2157 domain-containing protein [Flavobacterium rivuli]
MATLLKDLPELVENNVISPQTATDIERYYAARVNPQTNIMLTIFGVLGGILAGLGIILIFAHNWDNFSKTIKTGLAVLPLFIAQALAGYSILKNKSSVWKETAATLLFFAVGASISLVAQIYNISGDFPAFLTTWILLCLPLVYLLNSNAAAILLLVFSTWYSAVAGYSLWERPYWYLLFIAALLPFYIGHLKTGKNSNLAVVLNWLMPLSLLIAFGAFLKGADGFVVVMYMAFLCLMYNVGSLPFFANLKKQTGYLAFGELGIIIVLLMVSAQYMWLEITGNMQYGIYAVQSHFIIIWAVLLLISAILMFRYKSATFSSLKWATFLFPVLYFIAMVNVPLATILTNLVILAFGILTIRNGINKLHFRTLNFGILVLAVLTTIRFFDTNISFAIRGSLFLIVGIGFFAANYIVIKKKKEQPDTHTHEN